MWSALGWAPLRAEAAQVAVQIKYGYLARQRAEWSGTARPGCRPSPMTLTTPPLPTAP